MKASDGINGNILDRTMMIVAGPQASGKSHIINEALAGRLSPFGPDYDRIVCRLEQNPHLTYGDGESLNYKVVTRRHFGRLWTTLPQCFLLHLDIMRFSNVEIRDLASLSSREENFVAMRLGYGLVDLIRLYRHVVINTVITPWPVACRRLLARKRQTRVPFFPKQHFIYTKPGGECIYGALYEGWEDFVASLGSRVQHFKSICQEDGTTVYVTQAR